MRVTSVPHTDVLEVEVVLHFFRICEDVCARSILTLGVAPRVGRLDVQKTSH